MRDDDIETFFKTLISDKKERMMLVLISKGLSEEEILEALLNEEDGGD